MSPDEAKPITRFTDEINRLIDYYRKEYQLTYSETIGALEIIKMELFHEANDE
jgi:hypothetical protein